MRAGASMLQGFRLVHALVIMVLISLLSVTPASAEGAIDRARTAVEDLTADIWAEAGEAGTSGRRERLAEVIKAKTNIDILSRLAIGKYWRRLDTAQQTDYQRLFSAVIMDSLAGRLDLVLGGLSGSLDQHFRITGTTHVGRRDVLVRSKVTASSDKPFSVDWRLREFDQGPVIIDLVVEGVSLLVSQRAEFSSVIEKSGIDGLLKALEQRLPASKA